MNVDHVISVKLEPVLMMAGPDDVNRNGRCGKRFPSDCHGLTLVIVMMHLL